MFLWCFLALADDTEKEAKEVQEEAKDLAERAKRGQANIDEGEVERRKKEFYVANNTTNDLLKQVKEANETAHHAIVNGTKTLAKAQENLKLLEVCGLFWDPSFSCLPLSLFPSSFSSRSFLLLFLLTPSFTSPSLPPRFFLYLLFIPALFLRFHPPSPPPPPPPLPPLPLFLPLFLLFLLSPSSSLPPLFLLSPLPLFLLYSSFIPPLPSSFSPPLPPLPLFLLYSSSSSSPPLPFIPPLPSSSILPLSLLFLPPPSLFFLFFLLYPSSILPLSFFYPFSTSPPLGLHPLSLSLALLPPVTMSLLNFVFFLIAEL